MENETKSTVELYELFEAYFDCRQNKRNTNSAIAFEIDYESQLIELCEAINNGTYSPGRSITFVVDKPVKREIFAAEFKDRIVHHLVYNKINSLFEKEFIYDSYACRIGKGASLGISRIDRFIRQCSANYARDCYILKLDVKGFFMSINKNILFDKLATFIHEKYHHNDKSLLLNLCETIIFNDPTQGCIVNGNSRNWDDLPHDKSLFHAKENCGLPIGNLTSQVLANFYMNTFDHFMKHDLGVRYYGRYVDDFVAVHQSKEYLQSLVPVISQFLTDKLHLTLHPNKFYLQHFRQGVKFLGVMIKPHRKYIGQRLKSNFLTAFDEYHAVAKSGNTDIIDKQAFLSTMNSYLGMIKHYNTYRLRRKALTKKMFELRTMAYLSSGLNKFVLRKPKPSKKRQRYMAGIGAQIVPPYATAMGTGKPCQARGQ